MDTENARRSAARQARHSEDSDKNIERYLVMESGRNGIVALKMDGRGQVGYPDRMLILPGGLCIWVEVKSRGQRARKAQQYTHAQLRAAGHEVWVIDRRALVDALLKSLRERGLLP